MQVPHTDLAAAVRGWQHVITYDAFIFVVAPECWHTGQVSGRQLASPFPQIKGSGLQSRPGLASTPGRFFPNRTPDEK